MKTYTIEINQETVNYLQRLYYDVNTRKDIIQLLLTNKATDDSVLTSKPFITYSDELARLNAEYELAKLELEKEILPEELIGKHEYYWNVDFQNNTVNLTINCDCGVDVYEKNKRI